MLRLLIAFPFLFAAITAPAAAQPPDRPTGAEFWTPSDERMTFIAAGISFPRRAGAVSFNRSIAFGQRNVGLDNALIYASDDRQMIATAYVYHPGLAHSGLAAVGGEAFMRAQSGHGFRLLASPTVAAGGHAGVAIRVDYAGFGTESEASSAAYLSVGGWMVKIRVTGPEARRADVERVTTGLLDGIRFEGAAPRAAEPVELVDCPAAGPARPATLLAESADEAMEDAIMSHATGGPPAVPRRWCVSSRRRAGNFALPILRAVVDPPGEDSRRSVVFAFLTDSGGALEVAERHFRNRLRYALMHHGTGQTRVLGSWDAPPTDAQIEAVISGTDPAGGRARATIQYQTSGDSDITLHVVPPAPAS